MAGVVLVASRLAPAAAQTTPRLSAETRKYVSVTAPVVALTGVRVIDGTGAPALEGQTVVIADGRIRAAGSTGTVPVPPGAHVLELSGHTVIPGIVGLHNHTYYTTAGREVQLSYSAPRLYLGSGVTTIRTTGSISPYSEINLKATIEQGDIPGPRMHISGPYLTGGRPTADQVDVDMVRLTDPSDARRVVRYWSHEGATWIKAYADITRAQLGAVIDEAHKVGMKVTAHLCSVTFREAVALGIDALEHGLLVNTDYDARKVPDLCPRGFRDRLLDVDLAGSSVRATFREMLARGVSMTSTLAVFELSVPNRPPMDPRVLEALYPDARAEYLAARAQFADNGNASALQLFKSAMQYELQFVRAGGLLAAGVDPTGFGGALAGLGAQRNFELLVEAGFSPLEAVKIVTANGAKVLGQLDRLGTVTAGKLADLVVIQGNPLVNPADIRNVRLVFKDGIGFDSARLLESVKGIVGVK